VLYDLNRTVPPASAVLTPADMRAHLRIDHTDQDTMLAGLIEVATRSCESEAGIQCINATYEIRLPYWWKQVLQIPRAPLVSVSSVQYVDDAGSTQTLSAENYVVPVGTWYSRLHRADGATMPVLGQVPQPVTVTFVAGYGTEASDVPQDVRHWIMLLASHYYSHAEPVTVLGGAPAPVPETLHRLMAGFTRRGAV